MVKRDMFYFADIDEKFIDSTKDNEGLEDGGISSLSAMY